VIADIRGGLGTQVLEMMGVLSWAIENGQRVEEFDINRTDDDIDHNRVDWIAQVFAGRFPTALRNGAAKYGIWERGRLELLIRHADAVRALASLPPLIRHGFSVLHVRAGDRSPIKVERYMEMHRDRVIGDDPAVCRAVAAATSSIYNGVGDALGEWRAMLASRDVTGPPSSFTISALFLDPTKRLRVIDGADGPRPMPAKVYELIEFLRPHFKGLEWIG